MTSIRTRTAIAVLATGLLAASTAGVVSSAGDRAPDRGPAGAEAQPGGSIVVGTDREVNGWAPNVSGVNWAAVAVYDSLMKLDANGQPEPYLAESMETTDDGTTWVLTLRPGVEFSDGTPLDAEAVIYNIEQFRAEDSVSLAKPYAEWVETMTAVDDLTVEFVLSEPRGVFPIVLGMPFGAGGMGFMGSPTAWEELGEDFTRNPVGAGPYMLESWTPDAKAVLVRNPNYWQEGLPYLDSIEVRPLPDTETRLASLQNGDIDVDFVAYHTELSRAQEDSNLTTYFRLLSGGEWLYFNHARPPFDDHRMREAIIRSIDLDAMNAALYDGGLNEVNGFFSVDHPWYNADAGEQWPTYDPDRARELVEEYVADGGDPTFVYKSTNAPNRVLFSEFLQTQFAAVGLDVEVEFYDLGQYASTMIQSRDFQLAGWVGASWTNPFPAVPQTLMTDGSSNYGGYSNPELDVVLDEALATIDPDRQAELYGEAQTMINTDLPLAFYSSTYLALATQTNVHGIDSDLGRAAQDLYAQMWVEQ